MPGTAWNFAESNFDQRILVHQPTCPGAFILVVCCSYILSTLSASNSRHAFTGLPADTRTEDVQKFFDGYGRIIDCRVMTGRLLRGTPLPHLTQFLGFGFVEFESPKVGGILIFFLSSPSCSNPFQDAEDAVHNFNGKGFMGAK